MQVDDFRFLLDTNRISLRQIIMNADINHNNLTITYDSLIKALKNVLASKEVIDQIIGFISSQFNNVDTILIADIFKLIDKRSSFVFVIPSYNNIHNYLINLDSVRTQVYDSYLFRIIYIDDLSEDGTKEKVATYIKDYSMENQVQILQPKIRQRQGVARYTAFHKCFDDEIVLNLDGDDWLSDQLVLQKLHNHYNTNNLLAAYGSYYFYDETCIDVGQKMDYPYKNKLECRRQYPKDIIDRKDFRNYPWICGHLRSGYAKLFKSIEVKHYIGPDGFFFKIASDQSDMFPVLEQAFNRHLNICQPTYIYNKVNSVQYNTSYYNINQVENVDYKIYREDATRIIKARYIYPTINWDKTLMADHFAISNQIKDIDQNSEANYIFINTDVNNCDINLLSSILKSQPAIIYTEIETIKSDNYIPKGSLLALGDVYYEIRTIDPASLSLNTTKYASLASGLYNKQKLLDLYQITNDIKEVALHPIKFI